MAEHEYTCPVCGAKKIVDFYGNEQLVIICPNIADSDGDHDGTPVAMVPDNTDEILKERAERVQAENDQPVDIVDSAGYDAAAVKGHHDPALLDEAPRRTRSAAREKAAQEKAKR